jgi:hypothetical protein
MSTPKPWEQQPGETERAFLAFFRYLALGDTRSLAKLQEQLGLKGRTKAQLGQWSTKHDWVSRCNAWTQHMMQEHTKAAELAIADVAVDWARRQRDLRERELELANKALRVVELWVDDILRKGKAPRMRAAEAAKLLDIASRVGRLATGLHTQREEVSGVDGDPIKVQVAAAIAKVYGRRKAVSTPAQTVDVSYTEPAPCDSVPLGRVRTAETQGETLINDSSEPQKAGSSS